MVAKYTQLTGVYSFPTTDVYSLTGVSVNLKMFLEFVHTMVLVRQYESFPTRAVQSVQESYMWPGVPR